MGQTLADPDLKETWKERTDDEKFKERDKAYAEHEKAFESRDSKSGTGGGADLFPRMGDFHPSTPKPKSPRINIARQIINHHTASFARMPRVWNVPYSHEGRQDAVRKTAVIQGVFRKSRIKAVQPRNSHWLSARGDCLYGVEWRNQPDQKEILVRTYDPKWCYPDLDATDPGGLNDLLITYTVKPSWVREVLHIDLGGDDNPRLFILWNQEKRIVQVEDVPVPQWTLEHGLGFVPWRWVFNSAADKFGQADVVDIVAVQEIMGDALKLALDAARKRIDKAYWGRGIAGQVVPRPGQVVAFPNPQATIEEFPTADPPDMLFGVVNMLQSYAQAMGGISPISSEGMASGSIVTGSAIRHQVEAIESRTETKRVNLEQAFAILGEFILRVLEKHFKDDEVTFNTQEGPLRMRGEEVHSWYTCDASYGGFEGLSALDRGRWTLEGLGRIHDDKKAIEIAYPDEDSSLMSERVKDYQIRQARMTAESQVQAQLALQEAQHSQQQGQPGQQFQGNGQQPPQPPQPLQRPIPPGLSELAKAPGAERMVSMGEIQSLLNLIRDELKGSVYAIGDLALLGMSQDPIVAVEVKDDYPLVNSTLAPKKVTVVLGVEKDQPKMTLI